MASSNSPIPPTRLTSLTTSACASALSTATTYSHAATADWNNAIVASILQGLIAETSKKPSSSETSESEGSEAIGTPKYKFAVNSTIIQHLSDPSESSGDGGEVGTGKPKVVGRRGMHSASGAYWNNERDGMWSCKWEGGEERGMDVVVCVMWIGV